MLGGGGLLVAFPPAYAVIMPALYLPVIVMLLALVFRGVAFEFRSVAATSKRWWNFAFAGGSTLAAFCQGVILGGLIQGIKVENGAFAGGAFDWATPFALLCGLGVVAGYALLGATWLVMKTEGAVAERARAQAQVLLLAVLGFMARGQPVDAARRPAHRRALVLAAEHLLSLAGAGRHRAHRVRRLALARDGPRRAAVPRGDRAVPARLSRARDFVVSLSRAAVADDLGHRRGAGEPDLHAGRHAVLLPIILGYIVFIYWLFRGKVREGESYH